MFPEDRGPICVVAETPVLAHAWPIKWLQQTVTEWMNISFEFHSLMAWSTLYQPDGSVLRMSG